MPSQPSKCPECGQQGRWGFDDDWCHDDWNAAVDCPREGWYPSEDEAQAVAIDCTCIHPPGAHDGMGCTDPYCGCLSPTGERAPASIRNQTGPRRAETP